MHKTLITLLGILADIAPNSDPLEYFATAMHRHLGTLSPLLPLLLELDDQADATLIKLVQNLADAQRKTPLNCQSGLQFCEICDIF